MRRLVIAAAAAALLSFPARAQDTGIYFGAFVGGAALNSTLITPAFTYRTTVETTTQVQTPNGPQDVTVRTPVATRIPSQKLDDQGGSGFIWGLRVGVGVPVAQRFYLGIEGEVTFPQAAEISLSFLNMSYRGRLETEGAIYGRAGWQMTADTLLYVRSGIAVPRQVANIGRSTVERWAPTPAIGIGMEHRFQPRMSVRVDLTWLPALENNQIGSFRGVIGLSYHF
jgi:opacity protein-like surface antigen